MKSEQIARICHAANRALQIIQNDPSIPVSVGWDDLDPETQESAIDGVRGVRRGNGPKQSHANWMKFKLEHGWVLGPVKDEEKKEHPNLKPYIELDSSQKLKDSLFHTIVHCLMFVHIEEHEKEL